MTDTFLSRDFHVNLSFTRLSGAVFDFSHNFGHETKKSQCVYVMNTTEILNLHQVKSDKQQQSSTIQYLYKHNLRKMTNYDD